MKIEVKSINFWYNKNITVLNDINYSFDSGNIYVLEGANGSGKTTLSMMLLGLLKPRTGEVCIDNISVKRMRPAVIASKVGYLFQNTDMQLFANTVYEELAFPFIINKTFQGNLPKIESVLQKFGLSKLRDSFPLMLSGGEKQRLALATIFVRDVSFIILDEPSASIDYDGKIYLAEVINAFCENGGGVILITHDEELKALVNNAVCLTLDGGKLNEN